MRRSRRSGWRCPASCTDRRRHDPLRHRRHAGLLRELDELLRAHRFQSRPRPALVHRRSRQPRPESLEVLRYVRALGDNAIVVLGNHDLHLLALALGPEAQAASGDTLDDVLDARRSRRVARMAASSAPLAHFDAATAICSCMRVWCRSGMRAQAAELAREVERAAPTIARALFDKMYGDQPDRWSESLEGMRTTALRHQRVHAAAHLHGAGARRPAPEGPPQDSRPPWRPWFARRDRASAAVRVIFGHWSALGFDRATAWWGWIRAACGAARSPP